MRRVSMPTLAGPNTDDVGSGIALILDYAGRLVSNPSKWVSTSLARDVDGRSRPAARR